MIASGSRLTRQKPQVRRVERGRHWRPRLLEYWVACVIVPLFHYFRPQCFIGLFNILGKCVYLLMPARRKIALENLGRTFRNEKTESELRRIVKASVSSLLLSTAENVWFRHVMRGSAGIHSINEMIENVSPFSDQARAIHESTGGCIFVTPHLGCYTLLPYLFTAMGIPLTIPIQELGNDYIQQRWCPLNATPSTGGEIFVPKTNSLAHLRASLRHGRSVGLMADQRTMRGLAVEFMGCTAPTTPIPAMLGVSLNRPILVGACCRSSGGNRYRLILHEPIWADPNREAKAEIVRLTQEVNRKMGAMIRDFPDQYLWLHNRWKAYRVQKNRARHSSFTHGS